MTEEPLIYTSKGNLKISELEYNTNWIVNDDYIQFVERYYLDDKIVKESAHVYDKRGVTTEVFEGVI